MEKKLCKPKCAGFIIAAAVPAVLLAVYYCSCSSEDICGRISKGFSSPVRRSIGRLADRFASVFPLSLTELLYTLLGILAILFVVFSAVLIIKRKGSRLRTFFKCAALLLVILLWIWTLFCWLWNVEYNTESYAKRLGLHTEGVSVSQLSEAVSFYAKLCSELSVKVPRDGEGHLAESPGDAFSLNGLYGDSFYREFPYFERRALYSPKPMKLYSGIMTRIGYTGIYLPFTGESNINIKAPMCYMPSTVSHELAHQLGISSESEASFIGIAACILSDDPVYMYSGSLLAALELMNSLYSVDYDAWLKLYKTLSPEVLQDWADQREFWAQYETHVSKAANRIYDTYLKSNGQELGIRSYGACVDLLVSWYFRSSVFRDAGAVSSPREARG